MDISKLTIKDARRALDAKEYSSLELTNVYLDAIKKKDSEIHAYVQTWEEDARAQATRADQLIENGSVKMLTGIPMAIKDNILVEGHYASAGSKMLETYRATYDATVIEKLNAACAVFLGRANMDDAAMGSSTETSYFGVTRNPRDLARVPGGSSGGPAAAVAAAMALVALAALCGVVGLKPTYGAVSRFGLIALASSLDQIGPFGKTVADAEAVFEVIRGHDPRDSTSLRDVQHDGHKAKKIGVPRAFLEKGTEPDVLAAFEKKLSELRAAGYEIVDIDLPLAPHSLAVYYIIQPAEASTNLARYDGIRYAHTVASETIGEVYAKTRATGFGREVRRRILIGTFVLSSGYADAYYRKARAVQDVIRAEFSDAFINVDAIVTPTTPAPAFKFGEKSDPVAMYAVDIFTVPANIAGVPAISVPMGNVERDGVQLPTGFQIIAPHQREDTLFTIGKSVEGLV